MGQPLIREDLPAVRCKLRGVEEAIVLIRHDPLTDYRLWAQWLLKFAYWATEYSGEAQIISICTSEERAEQLALHVGYRGIWAPIDEGLPDERCQWRPAIHFKSPLKKWHQNYKMTFAAVRRKPLAAALRQLGLSLERLEEITAEDKD